MSPGCAQTRPVSADMMPGQWRQEEQGPGPAQKGESDWRDLIRNTSRQNHVPGPEQRRGHKQQVSGRGKRLRSAMRMKGHIGIRGQTSMRAAVATRKIKVRI